MTRAALFVDDEPAVLEAAARTLRGEAFDVLTAGSAAEAIELLEERPVDVVIADHRMPGTPGSTLLATVRQRWPEVARFMLSGHGTAEIALRAINEGQVARFFLKPSDPREIAAAIREVLQQRDLLICARRLLARVRAYQAEAQRLEREHPGLFTVPRDAGGAVLVGPDDCHALVREIARELSDEGLAPHQDTAYTAPLQRRQ